MRLLLVLIALAFPAAAQAAGPVLGVYSEEQGAGAQQAQTGFRALRRPFNWALIEPRPGHYDWAGFDAIVADAAGSGLTMFPFLLDAPAWETGGSSAADMLPPRDPADFATFAAAAVRRWGPGGTFWEERPWLPYRPIHAWQVWNEPNLPAFWRPAPNAAAYVRLLRVAATAIHGADAGATVVAAGLPESQGGIPQTQYLQQEYAAGLKGVADAVAVHAYAPDALGVVALVAGARRTMTAHGDAAPLWVTEFGWATAGEPSLFTVTEALQPQLLGASLYALRALAGPLDLGGVFVFRWQDPSQRTLPLDIWPYHSGLVRTDGTAKPGLAAVRAAIAAPLPASATLNAPAPALQLRLRKAGRRAVRVRCSRDCAASVLLVQRIPRPGRAPLQRVRARRSLKLTANRTRRLRLGTLAGRRLTFSAVTADGAARRVTRSFHRTSHR